MKNAEVKTLGYFLSIPIHDLAYLITVLMPSYSRAKVNPQIAFILNLELIRFEMWKTYNYLLSIYALILGYYGQNALMP